MRRSYEALPPHHAWAPGYYYSGLGPDDAPQLQAERVKQQWHAGRSGTKLSDGGGERDDGVVQAEDGEHHHDGNKNDDDDGKSECGTTRPRRYKKDSLE